MDHELKIDILAVAFDRKAFDPPRAKAWLKKRKISLTYWAHAGNDLFFSAWPSLIPDKIDELEMIPLEKKVKAAFAAQLDVDTITPKMLAALPSADLQITWLRIDQKHFNLDQTQQGAEFIEAAQAILLESDVRGIKLDERARIFAAIMISLKGAMRGFKATEVQTVIFRKKDDWTKDKAVAWLTRNDLKFGKVDENDTQLRYRQRDPGDFVAGSFITLTENFPKGVQVLVGKLKE